jgi:NAD(P)-dependent dehydrogenase (short-subunit alcohol dehydrogenase family)
MSWLKGKTAIVTGGGRGIGRATALGLAAEGARVVVASRTATEIAETESLIRKAGGVAAAVACDVADSRAVARLFDEATRLYGIPDVLVNAAAAVLSKPVAETTDDEWRRLMAVNVDGVFWCCREALRRMAGRGGAIVNVSSLAGIRGTEKFPGLSAYTTSKHAVIGITEAVAAEGRPLGVRVNAVAPGAVDTAMLRAAAPQFVAATKPADIAPTLVFLADTGRSGPLTGSVVEVHCNP